MSPRSTIIAASASAVLLAASSTSAYAVGVRIHASGNLDPCGYSQVVGLNPNGDNFLAVRSGPGSRYRMKAKLGPGQGVFSCDRRGSWVGIVYGRGDCGVSSPARGTSTYRGPCASGWAHGRYLRLVAG